MIVDVENRELPPFIRQAMIVFAIIIGAGYAFGPPRFTSSSGFDYIKSISWFPVPAWGFLFLIAGILMAVSPTIGHPLALVVWGTWGLGIVAATDRLEAWGSLVYPFLFAVLNGYQVWIYGQRKLVEVRHHGVTDLRQLFRPPKEGR